MRSNEKSASEYLQDVLNLSEDSGDKEVFSLGSAHLAKDEMGKSEQHKEGWLLGKRLFLGSPNNSRWEKLGERYLVE